MKKILSLILALLLFVSVLTGCGNKATENESTSDQAENTGYEYLFRDLPEAKYITSATEFAGGDGTESNPYQISNVSELVFLHDKIVLDEENLKDEYRNAYYVLTSDISLNDVTSFENWENIAPEYSWLPIGFGTLSGFTGVFDGKGYTISGLYINTNCGTVDEYSNDSYGLFDTVDGTVKNIIIDKSYFAVSGNHCTVGSIAGALTDEAVIENCSSSATLYGYDTTCGGIVGSASGGVDTGMVDEDEEREVKYSRISECLFEGTITQIRDGADYYLGGIVGGSNGIIENCTNKGTISFTASNIDSVGGISGLVGEGTISGCKNEGTLNCETTDEEELAIAGGIVGKIFVSATGSEKYMSRGATISKCENAGTVQGQMYAGGIAGQVSNDHNDYYVTISECINNGEVTSKDYTGGIIGHMNCLGDNENGESIVVENCENKADLTTGKVGGIISSFMSETGDVEITGCKNSGNLVSDDQHCAGIIAYWLMNSKPEESNVTVVNCVNTGNIASALNAGGIISYMDMPVCLDMGKNVEISITNCANDGTVTTSTTNGYIGGIIANWGMADINTVIDNCTNNGTLSITASADGMTDEEAEVMTISRIAGGIVGRIGSGLLLTTDSDETDDKNVQSKNAVLTITNCKNTGSLDVVNKDSKDYKNWFGGIIGNTCAEDGYSFFVENCTYSGFERGLGNEDLPDVGTK